MSAAVNATATVPRPELPLIRRVRAHGDRTAVAEPGGVFTYRDLLRVSEGVAQRLLSAASGLVEASRGDLAEARIAYLVPPGFEHVAVQWGIWRSGAVATPLAVSHPPAELAHVLDDAEPAAVIVHESLADRLRPLATDRGLPTLDATGLSAGVEEGTGGGTRSASSPSEAVFTPSGLPSLSPDRRALMIYTSGTTGLPKGVVTTHANVEAQVGSLVTAWEWRADDHVLLVLPLHHVHGIINVVTCALWSGACCQMLPRFEAVETWERFARGDLTVFMAVPTMYVRLIRAWEAAPPETRERWSAGTRTMRLMVSGSAALPVRVLERWREITGQVLLERYGMTEIGMGLSNPLRGERRPGCVGRPLPGVEVRRVDEAGRPSSDPTVPGELEVRGPGVFAEYWGRPEETASSFRDGWFRTGDVAVEEAGYYRLLGRTSVDIVKTGGVKVSAPEVEEALREHERVADCAVVGVPDPEWGERLCGALVRRGDAPLDPDRVRQWARQRLAPYKVPKRLVVVEGLPRNAMGKVQKHDVKELFTSEGEP